MNDEINNTDSNSEEVVEETNLAEGSNEESTEDTENAVEDEASVDPATLNHSYYEIDSDLLAKPNALVDILLTSGKKTVVFCNQPSEADLIEVVLSKKQLNVQKLIGRVPASRVHQAAKQLLAGECDVLVVTDISARELDLAEISQIVNYGIHEDPEIYLMRCQAKSNNCQIEAVISLVSPLDHGNFHYLKKVIDFEITKAELPDGEAIEEAKYTQFISSVKAAKYQDSDQLDILVAKIKEAAEYEEILKYLVHNTVNVLPELKVKSTQSRGGRNNYNDQTDGDDAFNEEEKRILKRNLPRKEFIRFYLGVGSADDYDRSKVVDLLSAAANLPEDQIVNFIDRQNYSFIDVLKENSSGLGDILDGYNLDNGQELVFKKATRITVVEEPKSDILSDTPAS